MATNGIPLAELEEFALELARLAGNTAQAHFRKPLPVENKRSDGFDPVTNADRAIERILRAQILDRYPDHGIVGEEEADKAPESEYTWYIDPIDGTRSFMMGSPLWGTLVGLTREARPVFGLLAQPFLEEVYFGAPNGSWLVNSSGRNRLKSRACRALANAIVASTHPGMFDAATRPAFDALVDACLLDRYGGDCYNYALLAAGFVDLVVEAGLKSYDIVPLIPILEGAGAVITNWNGELPLTGGQILAAATPELHTAALAILNP